MATTNKGLTQPPVGSSGWGIPLNEDFEGIDNAFGGVTSINVTGVTATPVVLTLAQYQNLTIKFSGTLTDNVTYQIPAGVGGRWVVQNNTTGAFTLTVASLGGGSTFLAGSGYSNLFVDGQNCVGNFSRAVPGIIAIWSGSVATIPVGWLLCDGTSGTIDLRDKFIVGAGSTYAVGATGGVNVVTLTQAQMPAHDHSISILTDSAGLHTHTINDTGHAHNVTVPNNFIGNFGGSGGSSDRPFGNTGSSLAGYAPTSAGAHTHSVSGTTAANGGGTSHENRPPYYALCYIVKI
jgi:microcystin-dependent protein